MSLRVLSGAQVESISSALKPHELPCLMAKVFDAVTTLSSSLGFGDSQQVGRAIASSSATQIPHRTTILTENHKVLFMPARMADDSASETSIKIVSVPKGPSPGGLPATTLVIDELDGSVKAMVNARKLTALRNAAGQLIPLLSLWFNT